MERREQSTASGGAAGGGAAGGARARLRALIPVSGQKDEVMTALRKVKTAPGRERQGLYLVETAEMCRRAVRYGGELEAVVCTPTFASSPEGEELRALLVDSCPIYSASIGLIGKCLEAKPTPDCVGLARVRVSEWAPLLERGWGSQGSSPAAGLWLGVDEGENADNLGMLLRSAEAAAVSGVLLGNGTVDPFGRRVVRGSRGAVCALPMALEDNMAAAVRAARERGVQVVATSANTTLGYEEVDYTRPTLLIVGNEHRGVSAPILALADTCVKIPMLGQINSLNISVAGSVALFEAVRQRRAAGAR